MDFFDKIIEALELERELGTRTVEIDRALLVAARQKAVGTGVKTVRAQKSLSEPPAPVSAAAAPEAPAKDATTGGETMTQIRDFAFFTGKPLSAAGEKLLEKMIAAMGYTPEQVYINSDSPARIVILLGSAALRERVPGVKTARGKWIDFNGVPAITTFSPDFILSNFSMNSNEMKVAKTEIWHVLKSAMARLSTLK